MLSIIVPSSREELSLELQKELQRVEELPDLEVICVSTDKAQSRAGRLNIGFHQSKGEMILFHHPRSIVEVSGVKHLVSLSLDSNREALWGGFTHQFDNPHYLLKFTSWYSNQIRGWLRGILYLDHCIYFDRRLWRQDLPDVEIFEDTILSQNFLKISKPHILIFKSITSAIRFEKNGFWKQALLNQGLKLGFHLRFPHELMNRLYEKNLGLNTKQPRKSK